MPLRLNQLQAELARGLAPLYLIAGSEPLLVEEARDQVIDVARGRGFTEREVLEVDRDFDWDRLAEVVGAPSLFASQRIIDLRVPTGKPGREGSAALVAWAENPDPDLLLVMSCESWDKKTGATKWARVLDQAGVRVDIWPVKARDLPGWIHQRMRAAGLEPEREAVMILAERLEGNLLAARQEIEKLALLKGRGAVTADDVLRSVADSSRFDSFLLAERMLAGQTAEGLRVAAGLRRTGIPLQLITGALLREFNVLSAYCAALAAGEDERAVFRRLNVWPARQGPMRAAGRRLNGSRLDEAFQRLSLIDRQSKGMAAGDAWHSLDHLVCAMASGRGSPSP